MRKVEKDFNDIPYILNNNKRKEAFQKNIDSSGYNYGKNLYKTKAVEDKLFEIYHKKCAYCEKDISDDDKHIEHYRPKKRYYWLAYSWDNLLLSCSRCNKAKSDKFPTINTPVIYNNEKFIDIHSLGIGYDKKERPKIINPEKENILDEIQFTREGKIFSSNSRVEYSINEIFKLNREALIEKRVKVINMFSDRIGDDFFIFRKKKDFLLFESNVKSKIKYFREEFKKESEFYTLRYFILNNIEIFFDDNKPLQLFVKRLIEKNEY